MSFMDVEVRVLSWAFQYGKNFGRLSLPEFFAFLLLNGREAAFTFFSDTSLCRSKYPNCSAVTCDFRFRRLLKNTVTL